MAGNREHAHELIDLLPEPQVSALIGFLETIVGDPVAAALRNAPFDDEPFTEEDRQSVAQADARRQGNASIPLETVLGDFGLSMADWETMGKTPLPEENGNSRRNA